MPCKLITPPPIRHAVGACLFSLTMTTCSFCSANNLLIQADTIDRSANPCTDFYTYANGSWLTSTTIPPDRNSYSMQDEMTEENYRLLHDMVKQAATMPSPSSLEEKIVGQYYRSGMNETTIEQAGTAPLDATMAIINGINTRADILPTIGKLHKLGIPALFKLGIIRIPHNNTRAHLDLIQGGLGLPSKRYYLDKYFIMASVRIQYKNHIAAMFTLAGDLPADANRQANTVLHIETQLARASVPPSALLNLGKSSQIIGATELNNIARAANWSRYFNELGIASPPEIHVSQPEFFNRVGKLIKRLPLDDWKTYLRWTLLHAEADQLPKGFVEENFDFFHRTVYGSTEMPPRWKRILTSLDQHAGDALGKLYVTRHFNAESKSGANTIINNIKNAMEYRITQADWMSPATKRQAINKLHHISINVGHPDQWHDYRSLGLVNDATAQSDPHYFYNLNQRLRTFEFNYMLTSVTQSVEQRTWQVTAPTVNAYYNPLLNEIVLPAGILQKPNYHHQADLASNYGRLGATIGHEFIHAFDAFGRLFDANGNARTWWTKQDTDNYIHRSTAIEQQFNEFTPIGQFSVNGRLTRDENIADLGGIKIAFIAFKKALQHQPQTTNINELTPEQRFFVSYAQSLRTLYRPHQLRLELSSSRHAPDNTRVMGPIANMPEFSQAFSCPSNQSPLRPHNRRVFIW